MLLSAISKIPMGDQWEFARARFDAITNSLPSATLLDLLQIRLVPDLINHFNPFFSKTARLHVMADITTWLELCVLEDRLHRIVNLGRSCSDGAVDEQLARELQVHRKWRSEDYIEWLIFEVEGSLQIRPAQFDVARDLIDNPGAIVQLNMGEGKTRVILPMLILHWGSKKDGAIRLVFLTQLL